MRKSVFLCLLTLITLTGLNVNAATQVQQSTDSAAQTTTTNPERRTLHVPGRRRRHVRSDRRRTHSIGSAYNKAGKGAARGAKGLARNIKHGRVVRGGKEFGKGMGEFGKQTGVGTARAGKKVGKTTSNAVKKAVTP